MSKPETLSAVVGTSRSEPDTEKLLVIFISYSHKDDKLREDVEKHLSNLRRQNIVRSWHYRKITAGTEWKGQIDHYLDSAGIILLLVSADLIASDYCWDVEIARAMEQHEAGTARVIPVILRPVDWQSAPFGKLQALPKNAKPVTTWRNRDAAFLDVVSGIRAAIGEMTSETRPASMAGGMGRAKIIVEIVIETPDSTGSLEVALQPVIQRIREEVPGVEVVRVRKGSIILTLGLAREEGERLRELIQDGVLRDVGLDEKSIISELEYLQYLINCLWDEDPSVRQSAARALGGIGREAREAVPGLI